MTSATDDATDWALAVAGQGVAFGRLFDRHRDRVFRHSLRLVSAPSDVDDVVAMTFLEAWRRRESVRLVDGSILPWLLVTATKVSGNVRRSARRYGALLARLPAADPAPDHAEAVGEGAAQRALQRLSPTDQQVIVLCVLEGLSEREAALAIGVPAGTVKSRLSRAKARLASSLPLLSLEEAAHEL